jgi:hypothetical protein
MKATTLCIQNIHSRPARGGAEGELKHHFAQLESCGHVVSPVFSPSQVSVEDSRNPRPFSRLVPGGAAGKQGRAGGAFAMRGISVGKENIQANLKPQKVAEGAIGALRWVRQKYVVGRMRGASRSAHGCGWVPYRGSGFDSMVGELELP